MWTNPVTDRPAAIPGTRLAQLVGEHLPLAVEGSPVQYQINQTCRGWVIELVHNGGVIKNPDQPAAVDPSSVAHVLLRPRMAVRTARVWSLDEELPLCHPLAVTVPAGESVFVELVTEE
jgi:hypothetical protein